MKIAELNLAHIIETIRACVFFTFTLAITVSDLRTRRIPDVLSLGGSALMIALALPQGSDRLIAIVLTGTIAAAIFYLVRLFTKGLGLGDVKLALFIGLFLGPIGSLMAFPFSAAAGLLYAVYALIVRKIDVRHRIPYAPFLVAGAYAAFLAETAKLDRVLF